MKKLALLLAATLLLGCCFVCASCASDDTTSSTPPAESSSQTSSEATSSQELSSQDVSSGTPSAEDSTSDESSTVSADTSSENSTDTPAPAAENLFWLTHFNDASREGAGVIFTETDQSGAWWTHVSFAPVEGQTNVYRVVEICNGGIDGSGVSLDIPEGGFVYAINRGNDYPALYAEDPNTYAQYANAPNYRNEAGAEMMASIATWAIGDTIRIEGLDLSALTIPTETADLNWYDPSYVCTARWGFAE